MRLYELTGEWLLLQDCLEDADEISPEMSARIDAVQGSIEAKVESIAMMAKQLESEEDTISDEIVRLGEMKSARAGKIKWLKTYLMNNLKAMRLKKVTGHLHGARIQSNSQPSVDMGDVKPEALPKELQRITVEADKTAIANHWKATGQTPEGVKVAVGEHVRIL